MARINIEDKIWSDSRFKALINILGDEEKAVGRLIRAWRIAQEWWVKDQQFIPETIWELNRLGDELFQVILARKTPDGIYVSGATEQFLWLINKKRAGRASGHKRREKAEQTANRPRTDQENPSNRTVATIENNNRIEHNTVSVRTEHENGGVKIEPPSLSPSLPLSLSLTQTTKNKKLHMSTEVDPRELLKLWNFHGDRGVLPQAKSLSADRTKKAKARLRENSDLSYWREVIEKIVNSSFCRGESETGWRATFDWLLKPDTHIKVIEGKYDRGRVKSKSEKISDYNQAMFDAVEKGEL